MFLFILVCQVIQEPEKIMILFVLIWFFVKMKKTNQIVRSIWPQKLLFNLYFFSEIGRQCLIQKQHSRVNGSMNMIQMDSYTACGVGHVQTVYEAKCIYCPHTRICVVNSGIASLRQHSQGKKHKSQAALLHQNSKEEKPSGSELQPRLTQFITKVAAHHDDTQTGIGIKNLTIPPPPKPIAGTSVEKWIGVSEQVAKAEALWAMKCAVSNYSFSSSNKMSELFQNIFPDSLVAKQFSVSHQKVSYLFSHGLGPYLQRATVNDILHSSAYFTIHFDETVSGQCKKQMDVLIRYWSETSACIQVHYLNSLFYGHAFAECVSKDLVDCFNSLKLPLSKLLCLSTDGHNVNKSIKSMIDSAVKEASLMLDFATFMLYTMLSRLVIRCLDLKH